MKCNDTWRCVILVEVCGGNLASNDSWKSEEYFHTGLNIFDTKTLL